MWDNQQDAHMRASGTVVRFNGKPVYIKDVQTEGGELLVNFVYLLTGRKSTARLSDELWNWKPVPTGFVNTGDKVFYVQRKPVRKWKQGLSRDNCSVFPKALGMQEMFKSKQFGRTVMRDYPSYKEAFAKVRSEGGQVAFHPDLAISRSKVGPIYLLYRTDTVGWLEQGELILGDDWSFLKEIVQEVVNANA